MPVRGAEGRRACGVRESGFRTVMNTGPDSAATVKHFHIHILGGGRWPLHIRELPSA